MVRKTPTTAFVIPEDAPRLPSLANLRSAHSWKPAISGDDEPRMVERAGAFEVVATVPGSLSEHHQRSWANVDTKAATLVTDVDREVYANESRLKQVFENLVRNAVEHGRDDVTVTLQTVDDGFRVEDDGPGIPDDAREAVFDAGYSTHHEGTGFGLSIVKHVVEAHGWEIDVTEGTEGGARFEVTGVDFVAD